jgi:hypothetical protein
VKSDEAEQRERPPDFYAKEPADSASIEDLLDYWMRQSGPLQRHSPKPTLAVRQRLLAAVKVEPERLARLLPFLPETEATAARVKKLYVDAQNDAELDDEWRKSVRQWLQFKSKYFLNDLLALARKVKDKEGYVTNEEALTALAKVDWSSAEPLLQSLAASGERREIERARARLSWRALTGGKLGALVAPPEGYRTFDESLLEIENGDFSWSSNKHLPQLVSGNYLVFAGGFARGGLWKKAPGQEAVRISDEGKYMNPLVTPDGKWVVASKADTDWATPNDVVRLNLQTGQERRVNLPPADEFEALAYVATHGQVLLRRVEDSVNGEPQSTSPAAPEFYLLDAATGQTQLVRGIFEPLEQVGRRFLQPVGQSHEFWAAIPDRSKKQTRVGRYNLKDFSFQALMVMPHLLFDSLMMWVDEAGAKLYVVYEDQLLRLPLRATP